MKKSLGIPARWFASNNEDEATNRTQEGRLADMRDMGDPLIRIIDERVAHLLEHIKGIVVNERDVDVVLKGATYAAAQEARDQQRGLDAAIAESYVHLDETTAYRIAAAIRAGHVCGHMPRKV